MRKTRKPRTTTTPLAAVRNGVIKAVDACEAKKAADITLLELEKGSGAFTDYFVICSGANPRQIQAISDEVQERLAGSGFRATHVEGYQKAEWVLLDYVDFVVHVFSPAARRYYDLERLWRSAKRVEPQQVGRAQPKARSAVSRPRKG